MEYLNIKEFLNDSSRKTLNIGRPALLEVDEALKNEGYERVLGDVDCTNGWQVDFWYSYYKDGNCVMLSGSLWYSGDFTLTKK